jgi:hypothetical protein
MKHFIVLALAVIVISAQQQTVGGFSRLDLTCLTSQVKSINDGLIQNYLSVEWTLIKVESQSVAGTNYIFTYTNPKFQ